MSKKVSVFYTYSSRKDLQKLEKKESKKIVIAIKKYTEDKNPLVKSKKLSGLFDGMYRYRIGNYRVIFEYDEKGQIIVLTILRIKHRKDVYK